MLLVCLGTGSVMKTRPVWEQDRSNSCWLWAMEVGYVIVVCFNFQDAMFTVSPITGLSQTVYCSNSDAFRTKHYLLWQWTPSCLNPLQYECAVLVSSALAVLLWLFTPQECTMFQKCRRIRYPLIIFNLCDAYVNLWSRRWTISNLCPWSYVLFCGSNVACLPSNRLSLKTRPFWEQGRSTQLLVVNHGSRLCDCCIFHFSGCQVHCLPLNSIKSDSLLF